MSNKRNEVRYDVPDIVVDPGTKKRYRKGKFLGRGGFARCYELTEIPSEKIYAGKVIAKSQIKNSDQKQKMSQEIEIHRSISHKHIVAFHTYFEDPNYIYIILELCSKRSLMEMHKRRKVFTEPEVRYIVTQIALACQYLHTNKIVHRDLKLGNLFLNEDMDVKVGDFGLATKISNEKDRKLTLCGTPNYIAPEVLMKKGHGFEVDVWSLGCIVYTLFVGKPPFETNDLKDTYKKIKNNDYEIPNYVPEDARDFIRQMLKADPSERPWMIDILNDPYLTKNYVPSRLPLSCLTTAPRYNNGRLSIMPTEFYGSSRRPLGEKNTEVPAVKINIENAMENKAPTAPDKPTTNGQNNNNQAAQNYNNNAHQANQLPKPNGAAVFSKDYNLKELSEQLHMVVAARAGEKEEGVPDDAEDPAATPLVWISKWVDYTDRYGIGYQLCDNSVGILFNDITRLVLLADGVNLQYIERDGTEYYLTLDCYPTDLLKKKITLLKYFRNYMNEHLLKCGDKKIDLEEKDELTRLPYLNNWFRTRNAIIFHLTNGTVQMNFFQDHTKLILCPHMGAVTYVDENREFRTYKFSLIEKYGCTKELYNRLRYARDIVDRLMTHRLQAGITRK